jgi:hypothetical protein
LTVKANLANGRRDMNCPVVRKPARRLSPLSVVFAASALVVQDPICFVERFHVLFGAASVRMPLMGQTLVETLNLAW